MSDELNTLGSWFDSRAWPPVPCPSCRWQLSIKPTGITEYQDAETAEAAMFLDYAEFDPTEQHGWFHTAVHCDDEDCRETVILAGVWRYAKEANWPVDPTRPNLGLYTQYHLEYMSPPPRLMKLSSKVPDAVRAGIVLAAKLMWMDPSAAINRLRASVEVLMDDFGVPRSRSLHDRINSFAEINTYAATILQAVKWAGNQGSHGLQDITVKDVLETAELMQHALELLYDKADLFRRAQSINEARRISTDREGHP